MYDARANDKGRAHNGGKSIALWEAEHWRVADDDGERAGDYVTREGALEAIYLAASNDIKSGHGITIRIEPPPLDAPATGGHE